MNETYLCAVLSLEKQLFSENLPLPLCLQNHIYDYLLKATFFKLSYETMALVIYFFNAHF